MFKACWAKPSRIIVSSSSHSSLHTSAALHKQSSRQHVARAIKKSNIAAQEKRLEEMEQNKPSVVLGTRYKDAYKWKKSLLSKILVKEDELFSENNNLVPTEQPVGTVHLPKYSNFGICKGEQQLLFGELPLLTSTNGNYDVAANTAENQHVDTEKVQEELEAWKKRLDWERSKANAFARVIDLRNANAGGIAFENRRRIIETFSTPKNPFDPGRAEVQAALLTYKIRNLWNHLDKFRRDLGNRRGLRMLVHKRAKVLKYLKKVDNRRYETLLKQLALEPESVEGELVV